MSISGNPRFRLNINAAHLLVTMKGRSIGICDHCEQECKVLRCTRCKKAQYCSRACQKKHWKALHKYTCSPISDSNKNPSQHHRKDLLPQSNEKKIKEHNAFFQSLSEMPLNEAHSKYLYAQEQIEILKEEANLRSKELQALGKRQQRIEKQRIKTNKKLNKSSQNRNQNKAKVESDFDFSSTLQTMSLKKSLSSASRLTPCANGWSYTVEYLANISCFLILLVPQREANIVKTQNAAIPNLDDLSLKVTPIHFKNIDNPLEEGKDTPHLYENDGYYQTRVELTQKNYKHPRLSKKENTQHLLSIILPGHIPESDGTLTTQTDCIYLRFKCRATSQPIYKLPISELINQESAMNIDNNESGMHSTGVQENVNAIQVLSSTSQPHHLESLRCRQCQFFLLQDGSKATHNDVGIEDDKENRNIMKRVLPLPSGNLEEIGDYLMCTPEQLSTIQFSSSCPAIRGVALEDGNALVLNAKDFGNRISILSMVQGYGENNYGEDTDKNEASSKEKGASSHLGNLMEDAVEYRGVREWKDKVGGATVCCSNCCSILGFSLVDTDNPESIRLFKHRVSAGGYDERVKHMIPEPKKINIDTIRSRGIYDGNNCGSFIAHEMIRYAERHAVFTFTIMKEVKPEMPGDALVNNEEIRRGMILRVLSWDTKMSVSHGKFSPDANRPLYFENVLKVVFQEYEERGDRDTTEETLLGDMASWTWLSKDLCCDPSQPTAHDSNHHRKDVKEKEKNIGNQDMKENIDINQLARASVRLYLLEDEYDELEELIFAGSLYFPANLSELTAQLKLGKQALESSNGRYGLSMLQYME